MRSVFSRRRTLPGPGLLVLCGSSGAVVRAARSEGGGGNSGESRAHLFMYGLCAKFVPAAAPADVVVLSEDGEVFTPGESVA